MKLFYSSGSCAIGIHILLQEIGQPFELQKVDLQKGEQRLPAYLAVNPKGLVPALQFEDGSVLTEWPAIATYLGYAYPEAKLVPEDKRTAAHMLETICFICGTMHMNGFRQMFQPQSVSPDVAGHEAIKAQGAKIFTEGFTAMAALLGEQDYLFTNFSLADTALFFVAFWAGYLKIELPPAIVAHQARMMARPSVQHVMKTEFA